MLGGRVRGSSSSEIKTRLGWDRIEKSRIIKKPLSTTTLGIGYYLMKTLPDYLKPYKKTAIFNETNLPPGFLKTHRTKSGTWGKIIVLEGGLIYTIIGTEVSESPKSIFLTDKLAGVIEPCVDHYITLDGDVMFYVEFYSHPNDSSVRLE